MATKILVVDDEEGIRHLCGRGLQQAGYEVTVAASGEQALTRLDQDWDIILTDIMMPGAVNGLVLLESVRRRSSADVLIMTAYPELDSAVKALRDGAYDYLVKPFNLEALIHAVGKCAQKRQLSRELAVEKELRRIYEIFGSFAAPEVARVVLSHPNDFWKRGEKKEVTVLFADVRKYTTFAEKTRPEVAVAALNDIFSLIVESIKSEGGVVNKFLGDGMMAFFGAPVSHPEHARAAVRAALRMRHAVENMAQTHQSQGLEALRIGIGINSGEVIAGCLGTRERTEYSVIGHAVNVASRLEHMAGPGQILSGIETIRTIKDLFRSRELGPMTIAGVAGPVPVFEILS